MCVVQAIRSTILSMRSMIKGQASSRKEQISYNKQSSNKMIYSHHDHRHFHRTRSNPQQEQQQQYHHHPNLFLLHRFVVDVVGVAEEVGVGLDVGLTEVVTPSTITITTAITASVVKMHLTMLQMLKIRWAQTILGITMKTHQLCEIQIDLAVVTTTTTATIKAIHVIMSDESDHACNHRQTVVIDGVSYQSKSNKF